MNYITAILVALVALVGTSMAMVASTTSGTLPANVLNFTDTYTPTMVGYFGLLAMPLDFGVPTGSLPGDNLNGNWEGIDTPSSSRGYPMYPGDISHPGQSTEFVASL